jgi:hypothetical protein
VASASRASSRLAGPAIPSYHKSAPRYHRLDI